MKRLFLIVLVTLATYSLVSQDQSIIKNSDFSELPVLGDGTAQDGMPIKYVSVDGKIARSLTGKEFTYSKQVLDLLLTGVNAGWINSPNWRKKYSWRVDDIFNQGLYREKSHDQSVIPTGFSVNNIIQPSKGHPLYQFFINQNDSLYQPSADIANTKEYLIKVQNFENNSPRLKVVVHVNNTFRETSITNFIKEDRKFKLKTPHDVYHRNDSIWFKDGDIINQENNELRFQKNSTIIVIGNIEGLNKGKGITEGFSEYWMQAVVKSGGEGVNRLDQVMIELSGAQESIELFIKKINWKQIDKAFKYKLK
jgi:hypothetical protein